MTNTKTDKKIKNKKESSRILEEAPLFAGLDGFVLSSATKSTVESKQKKTTGEKKSAGAKNIKTPASSKKTSLPKSPGDKKPLRSEAAAVLLSVKEMCNLLKISRATLVRMDKSGQLPGRIKLGGSVRFHRETVELWLQSLISPTSPILSTQPGPESQSSG